MMVRKNYQEQPQLVREDKSVEKLKTCIADLKKLAQSNKGSKAPQNIKSSNKENSAYSYAQGYLKDESSYRHRSTAAPSQGRERADPTKNKHQTKITNALKRHFPEFEYNNTSSSNGNTGNRFDSSIKSEYKNSTRQRQSTGTQNYKRSNSTAYYEENKFSKRRDSSATKKTPLAQNKRTASKTSLMQGSTDKQMKKSTSQVPRSSSQRPSSSKRPRGESPKSHLNYTSSSRRSAHEVSGVNSSFVSYHNNSSSQVNKTATHNPKDQGKKPFIFNNFVETCQNIPQNSTQPIDIRAPQAYITQQHQNLANTQGASFNRNLESPSPSSELIPQQRKRDMSSDHTRGRKSCQNMGSYAQKREQQKLDQELQVQQQQQRLYSQPKLSQPSSSYDKYASKKKSTTTATVNNYQKETETSYSKQAQKRQESSKKEYDSSTAYHSHFAQQNQLKQQSQPMDFSSTKRSMDEHLQESRDLSKDNKHIGSSIYSLQHAQGSTNHNTFGLQQTASSLANPRETTSPNGRRVPQRLETTVEEFFMNRVIKIQSEKRMLMELEGGSQEERILAVGKNVKLCQSKKPIVLGVDQCSKKPLIL